jgi:phospholipase A1
MWKVMALLAGMCAVAHSALAQDALLRCSRDHKDDERARLSCYDGLARETEKQEGLKAALPRPFGSSNFGSTDQTASYLTRAWRLNKPSDGDKEITGYRPAYVIWRWTDDPNQLPNSPSPGHTVTSAQGWQPGEGKVQLSAKADLFALDVNALGIDSARLWFAYTQQSHWQILNGARSAPFRETNYEPEFILTLKTAPTLAAEGLKLINFGVGHQSNGRSLPESRSWHRMYLQAGIEPALPARWGRLSVMPRLWWRLPESGSKDDNRDLASYVGRGEMLMRWETTRNHIFSLLARNSFSPNHPRGFLQLDWMHPSRIGPMKWYVQLTSGYGESLVDYNFRQNTVGAGIVYDP